MRRQLRHLTVIFVCVATLFCVYAFGANAYTYPSMPSNWENVTVTVGSVTMPLELYPAGSTYSSEKRYMTVAEQAYYGLSVGDDIDLRGWDCVGFARYVYTALFYKYAQNATIDTSLAYKYSTSYAYVNMIEQVLGTQTLSAGYSADTIKTLFTSCRPGAVMRVTGHSMVLMAIYDDGCLIYDANFSSDSEVSVRAYTWQSFVNSFGSKDLEALQMPAYYPGYAYSTSSGTTYEIDTSTAGKYVVTASVLNVRNKPATSSTIKGTLTKGTVVEVAGTYNGWAQITYNGNTCWVSMDYLTAYTQEVEVTFDANGGTASYTSATYLAGSAFGSLPTATKTARTLLGWSDGTTTYTESSIVPSAATLALTAKWCIQTYTDVAETSWYATYVEKAYSYGLISLSTKFNPDSYTTRGQLITVLGREYERETGTTISNNGSSVFTDVKSSAYYASYVAWGNEVGIVKGTTSTTFAPTDYVTREQIAEFLYRLAIYTGYTTRTTADTSVLSKFSDADQVSSFAKSAVCWAVEAGILKGDDKGCINPKSYAKRSEMVTIFVRYVNYVSTNSPLVFSTITFDANGGTCSVSSQKYVVGEKMGTLPVATKAYRTFLGWYNGSTLYTSSSVVKEGNLTLTAKWQVLGYTDVSESAWYVKYLESGYDYGLITGEGTFGATTSATRSEIVTYIGKIYETLTGTTIAKATSCNFTDVDLTADYAKYVAWGNENGLVKGVSQTEFSPDANTTRQQVALFLYRLAKYMGVADGFEADTSVLSSFSDGDSVGKTYQEAMCWAVSVGIISGTNEGKLNPSANVSRAELLTMVIRYLSL